MRPTPWLLAAALLAACASPIDSEREDPGLCYQTYEFGNHGCADLAGVVTDRAGRPLAGAYVGVVRNVDPARRLEVSSGFLQTDAEGKYRLRVIRYHGPPTTTPDTVSVWVRAGVPPTPPVVGVPGPMDSAVVVLELRPIGARAGLVTAPTLVVPVN